MAIIGRIRQKAGLAVVVIAIAILAFIFNDLFTQSNTIPSNIAKVNGVEITSNELNEVSQTIETNMKQQKQDDNLSPEESFTANQQAFNELFNEKLLQGEYELLGVGVSQEEMNDMFFGNFIHPLVMQNFADPQTGQYNKQAISQYISQFDKLPLEEQLSWRNFEKYIKKARQQEKYEKILAKSMYMPSKLASHISDISNQVTDSRYVLLNFSTVADNTIKITEEDYKKYYEEHKNEFRVVETLRDVEFVRFNITPSAEDIKFINDTVASTFEVFKTVPYHELPSFVSSVSDLVYDSTYFKREVLNQIYPDSILSKVSVGEFIPPFQNQNSWVMGKLTSVQARPDSVRFSSILILNEKAGGEIKRSQAVATQLKDSVYNLLKANPESFETQVANFSDDPEAKKNLGDGGWLLDGSFQPDLNSKIIETPINGIFVHSIPNDMGYWIIKVTGKTTPINKLRMATITMEIRPSEQTINQVRDKANTFLGEASNMATFTSAAQKQNLNILTSPNLRETDFQLNGTPYAREIVRWAYNKDTKKGDVAPEIYELPDMFVVVGLKDIKEKGILSLEQVKPFIENMVRIEKKAEILTKKAEDLIKTDKNLNSIAAKLNISVDSAQNVSFNDAYFVQAGPEMRVLGSLASAKSKGIQKPIKGYNGIYIIDIDNIRQKPVKEDPKMIQQSFEMKTMQKTSQLRLPIQVLLGKAKVESNFSFFY